MEIVLGIVGVLITLTIIVGILSIEKHLRQNNITNKKIIELLKEIKEGQSH